MEWEEAQEIEKFHWGLGNFIYNSRTRTEELNLNHLKNLQVLGLYRIISNFSPFLSKYLALTKSIGVPPSGFEYNKKMVKELEKKGIISNIDG